ncbi:MAG: hypothetical protein H6Q65_642 [Firmicutes bacterium]|nr:hypothetical protein [Bacillota bacterium]
MKTDWRITDNRYLLDNEYDGYMLLECLKCGAQEQLNYLDSDPQEIIDAEVTAIIDAHKCI